METIETVEMHTGGEPVRIIVSGYPTLPGATLLDKRRAARERFDHVRRRLMHEPRGHYDMYGALPVAADHPGAAFAVLFLHNEGYSTMCGHATIALGRWAVDTGRVPAAEPETRFVLQCPCGPVQVAVEVRNGKAWRSIAPSRCRAMAASPSMSAMAAPSTRCCRRRGSASTWRHLPCAPWSMPPMR
jgi:proline racemase